MKLDPERVVLDDGKFEMLLVPSPKTAADLQNLVLALLNQPVSHGYENAVNMVNELIAVHSGYVGELR